MVVVWVVCVCVCVVSSGISRGVRVQVLRDLGNLILYREWDGMIQRGRGDESAYLYSKSTLTPRLTQSYSYILPGRYIQTRLIPKGAPSANAGNGNPH